MSNKVILADNGNARMEADTILKNGRSSKSQKSRGNMFLTKTIGIIIIVGIFVSMAACGGGGKRSEEASPESDGIKAAKAYCECEKNFRKEQEDNAKRWKNLDNNSDQQRKQYINEGQNMYKNRENCHIKAGELYEKLNAKYQTNKDKHEKFLYALNGYRNNCNY